MIVVTNRIPVAAGYEIDFEDRFKKRVRLVDRSPGFIRNEVHRPRPMKLDHATGTYAQFDNPGDVEVDSNGDLLIVDMNNHAIRKYTISTTAVGGASSSRARNAPWVRPRATSSSTWPSSTRVLITAAASK